jgi:hypothetical protein
MPHNLVGDTDVAAEHVTGHGKAKSFIFPRLCRQGAIVAPSLSDGDRRIIGYVAQGQKRRVGRNPITSGLARQPDILRSGWHVRFAPVVLKKRARECIKKR